VTAIAAPIEEDVLDAQQTEWGKSPAALAGAPVEQLRLPGVSRPLRPLSRRGGRRRRGSTRFVSRLKPDVTATGTSGTDSKQKSESRPETTETLPPFV
jgi:hypothetical protein